MIVGIYIIYITYIIYIYIYIHTYADTYIIENPVKQYSAFVDCRCLHTGLGISM